MGATGNFSELLGDGGDDTMFAAGSFHGLNGGDGNDWVGVSGNSNILLGDAGNDYLAATGNNSIFNGGPGNDQMAAAAGHSNNGYIFQPDSGQDFYHRLRRRGHQSWRDVVDLRGFGLVNFAALDPYMNQVGADTVITLNGADILTLKNINSGTLVDNDFVFV